MRYSPYFNDSILLKNLVNIRWIAISGQLIAIFFVYFYLKISIPLIPCLLVVIISIVINILSLKLKTASNYLSDNEAFYFLLYDTSHLAVLLYLTGGIYNPFSLLLIAPVIISASFLKIGHSIFHSLFSIFIVIFISIFYIEIDWLIDFFVPDLFTYGLITSLIISIIFIATYVYISAKSSKKLINALNQTQLELVNHKKMSEIGSFAAAAVHEFSTPLNTIFLILSDLQKDRTLNTSIQSEIRLIESQAVRCKNILLSLSKNPQNLQDTFLQKTTLSNLIKLNFKKFKNNNINLKINIKNPEKENEPSINFSDEIMYGLGNIIQNAIEHAKSEVSVNISWDKTNLYIIIMDNGLGFSKEILDKIGDPFISKKNNKKNLGLGIFIAKYLIEKAGGRIMFTNLINATGSLVEISLIRK